MEKLLTAKETAEILRISVRTLYRWIDAGKVPAKKIGEQYRFVEAQIEAMIQ